MDQNKIGNFISKVRKNKKLTQKELAERLHISEKTISKWECGKGLPEVSLMKPLCKELDITVTELLNGEKETTEEGIINYIDYTKKKSKHKIIFLSIIFILLITFILSTVVYFFNSYNKIAVYYFEGSNENFNINEMYLTKSNMYNILTSGNIEVINKDINPEDILDITIKSDKRVIIGGSYSNYNGHTYTEKYGYNELFDEDKLNNISNWYIEVSYKKDNEIIKEQIKLNNTEVMRNNEFISKKVESIGENHEEDLENNEENILERFNQQSQDLINNGYTEINKDELYGSLGIYEKTAKNEIFTITIGAANPSISYTYKADTDTVVRIYLIVNSQYIDEKELKGSIIKDNWTYYFSYNKETKIIEYTNVFDNNFNKIETKEYPSISNLENTCQNIIDLQLELFDILIKPYL